MVSGIRPVLIFERETGHKEMSRAPTVHLTGRPVYYNALFSCMYATQGLEPAANNLRMVSGMKSFLRNTLLTR